MSRLRRRRCARPRSTSAPSRTTCATCAGSPTPRSSPSSRPTATGTAPCARRVAALAGGATRLGVADIGEALALRRAGIVAPIVAWLHAPGADFAEAAARGIELGISSFEQLQQAAAAASADRPVGVHLKLETGLVAQRHRARGLARRVRRGGAARAHRPAARRSRCSATSRTPRPRTTGPRCARSRRASAVAASARSRAAAAAPRRDPRGHRPARVAPRLRAHRHRPVRTVAVRRPHLGRPRPPAGDDAARRGRRGAPRARGQGVSYGYDYRTERETTLALVPLGYADGVPRQASGAGPGRRSAARRFTVAGRIAMDQFVVDVGDHSVAVGDEVVLFGDPTLGAPAATTGRMPRARSTTRSSRASARGCRAGRCRRERPRPARRLAATRSPRPTTWRRSASEIGRMLRPGDLVVLTGPLGAGKTTLTRGIARGLGVRGPVQSPTFVLARTHPSLVGGAPLVHVDAYRLGSAAELDDLDIDFDGSVVVVEWGRGMVDGLRDALVGGRARARVARARRTTTPCGDGVARDGGARRRRPATRHDHPAARRRGLPWKGDPRHRHLARHRRRGRRARRRRALRGRERSTPAATPRSSARSSRRRWPRHPSAPPTSRMSPREWDPARSPGCGSASRRRARSRSGRGIPVVPVVSHDAVALELLLHAALTADWGFAATSSGATEPFAVVTDARRREFAYTVYRGIDDDGLPIRVAEPALVPRDELDAVLARRAASLRRDAERIPAAMLALAAARAPRPPAARSAPPTRSTCARPTSRSPAGPEAGGRRDARTARDHRDDLDAIMALERASFPTDAWSDAMMREELASPHGWYVVDDEAGRLVGYAGLRAVARGDGCRHPDHRDRRGLAGPRPRPRAAAHAARRGRPPRRRATSSSRCAPTTRSPRRCTRRRASPRSAAGRGTTSPTTSTPS